MNPKGWAVGANGTIIHTTDGGVRWLTEESGTTHPLSRVFFSESSQAAGCAVGFGGTIITYPPKTASSE
ncbi:MAG: hypothetical protein WKF84_16840 [Pyrinomonadaceae bacterium]